MSKFSQAALIMSAILVLTGCGSAAQQAVSASGSTEHPSKPGLSPAPVAQPTAPADQLPPPPQNQPPAPVDANPWLVGGNIPSTELVTVERFADGGTSKLAPDGGMVSVGSTCFLQYGGKVQDLGVHGLGEELQLVQQSPVLPGTPCPLGTIFLLKPSVYAGWAAQTAVVDDYFVTEMQAMQGLGPNPAPVAGVTAPPVNETFTARVLNVDRFWSACMTLNPGQLITIGQVKGKPLVLFQNDTPFDPNSGACQNGTIFVDDFTQASILPQLR